MLWTHVSYEITFFFEWLVFKSAAVEMPIFVKMTQSKHLKYVSESFPIKNGLKCCPQLTVCSVGMDWKRYKSVRFNGEYMWSFHLLMLHLKVIFHMYLSQSLQACSQELLNTGSNSHNHLSWQQRWRSSIVLAGCSKALKLIWFKYCAKYAKWWATYQMWRIEETAVLSWIRGSSWRDMWVILSPW